MAESSIEQNQIEKQVLKRCTKCQIEKSVLEFSKEKKTKDGLSYWCRDCREQYRRENKKRIVLQNKQYRQAHKGKAATYRRKHYLAHKKEILIYEKEYRQVHKKEKTEYNKQYGKKHKKEIALRMKQYLQTEHGKNVYKRANYKRRALKRDVGYEIFNPDEIFERDGYRCRRCGKKTRPTYNQYHSLYPNLDHIVPLSKGGAHTQINTQCLCRQCNMEKNANGVGDQLRMFA